MSSAPHWQPGAANFSIFWHFAMLVLFIMQLAHQHRIFIQGRFVSWAPHWQPGAANFSGVPWRFANAPVVLPGYSDALLVRGV